MKPYRLYGCECKLWAEFKAPVRAKRNKNQESLEVKV